VSYQNKFDTLVRLVGFTTEIYYDAWPHERQICHIYIHGSARLNVLESHLLKLVDYVTECVMSKTR